MKKLLVTNIQRYSIHDGEGIRTTVFFKGCPLSCIWCHNPETQQFTTQLLFQKERCTGCGSCSDVCPNKAIKKNGNVVITDVDSCKQCGKCLDYCSQNIRELSGKLYSVDELMKELEKDRVFYEQSGGGITLSGGEVLSQDSDYIEELLWKLHRKGYHVNIDTSGYGPYSSMERMLPYVDTFLYDIKSMDPIRHQEYIGVDNALILQNLKKLSGKASLWIRIPVVGGFNNTLEDMKMIAEFLKNERIKVKQINLLPYHNTGSGKYERLQWKYKGDKLETPEPKEMENYKMVFESFGFDKIKIGG